MRRRGRHPPSHRHSRSHASFATSQTMLSRLFTNARPVQARFATTASAAKFRAHGVPAQVVKYVMVGKLQWGNAWITIVAYACFRIETEELNDPKGSEVLIKMLAAPINPSDINLVCHYISKRYQTSCLDLL
jgi:hypothetical protein